MRKVTKYFLILENSPFSIYNKQRPIYFQTIPSILFPPKNKNPAIYFLIGQILKNKITSGKSKFYIPKTIAIAIIA